MAKGAQVQRLSALLTLLLVVIPAFTGVRGRVLRGCPCGETYVVRKGESLQMVSEKCNDPFILETNPQILLDQGDFVEGQELKMECSQHRISLCDIAGALPIHLCK